MCEAEDGADGNGNGHSRARRCSAHLGRVAGSGTLDQMAAGDGERHEAIDAARVGLHVLHVRQREAVAQEELGVALAAVAAVARGRADAAPGVGRPVGVRRAASIGAPSGE